MNKRLMVIFLAFLTLTLLLYLPTINAPWQFDDLEHVLRRNALGQNSLGDLLIATIHPVHNPKGTRSFVNATFLLNWKLSPEPPGFHLVNILIHSLAATLVYFLIRLILTRLAWTGEAVGRWSVIGSLLFLVHPIQTQSVAYITQRFESLAGLFFLASMYFFLRKNYLVSFVSGFLAASAKEIAITLPFVLISLDFFFGRAYPTYWKKRLFIYLIFLLLSLKVATQLLFSPQETRSILTQQGGILTRLNVTTQVLDRQRGLNRTTYFLTQLNVIPTYIRMLFLPIDLSIDHDFHITTSLSQWPTPLSTLFLLLLLGVMVFFARRQPLLSFSLLFFFATLAISSSLFPIDDVINEHRLYLPMFGFVLFVVWSGRKFSAMKQWNKVTMSTLIVTLLLFSLFTFRRSIVWSTPLNLWEDAWKKAPNKPRTNKNYGFLLTEAGRMNEGIERLRRAVELADISDYRRNLGLAYLKIQDYKQAETEFLLAAQRDPSDPKPPNDLGVVLAQLGKYPEAIQAFHDSLKLDPQLYEALIGVGGASILTGDYQTAEIYLQQAITREPNDPRAYSNLAILYNKMKQTGKAKDVLDELAKIAPSYPGLKKKYLELEIKNNRD